MNVDEILSSQLEVHDRDSGLGRVSELVWLFKLAEAILNADDNIVTQ